MQRNGQNPIKAVRNLDKKSKDSAGNLHPQSKSENIAGHCPACKTEVPPKPGFRFSALKCPKCGILMGKHAG